MPQFARYLSKIKLVVFDFDGVFTDNTVYVSDSGQETVVCSRSDGLGLEKIREMDIPMWVISTESNPVVGVRCKKLSLDYIQNCQDKLYALKGLVVRYDCELENVLYVGNDINDSECLEMVGFPVVVADAHDDVIDKAKYITNNRGGHGAVREVCDLLAECSFPV